MKEFYKVWVPPVLLWLCVEQLLQRGVLSIVKVSCVECLLPLSNNQGYTSLPSRRSSKESVCRMALPLYVCVPPQIPSCVPSPPCWNCLTTLSYVWLHTGTTLVLPFGWKTTSWISSKPTWGVRWWHVALTCSNAGSERSGPLEARSEAGLPYWVLSRDALDRKQLGALLSHCKQHSKFPDAECGCEGDSLILFSFT